MLPAQMCMERTKENSEMANLVSRFITKGVGRNSHRVWPDRGRYRRRYYSRGECSRDRPLGLIRENLWRAHRSRQLEQKGRRRYAGAPPRFASPGF